MVNTMVNTMVTANIIIDNNETILTKNIKLQNLIDTIIELESYEKNNLEYDEGSRSLISASRGFLYSSSHNACGG